MGKLTITADNISAEQILKIAKESGVSLGDVTIEGDVDMKGGDITNANNIPTKPVGGDELADALGTSDSNPITGTTHLESVDTEDATIGADTQFLPEDRQLISNGDTTVSVPGDYATVQEAVNNIPFIVRHEYNIEIDDGDYSGEDVVVPTCISPFFRDGRGSGSTFVSVIGNTTTPGNVTLNSFTASGTAGVGMSVSGIRTTGENPRDDDGTGIAAYWCEYMLVKDCEVRNATRGVEAYGAHVHVNSVDFGSGSCVYGLYTKKGGKITEQTGAGCSGQVTQNGMVSGNGPIFTAGDSSTLDGDNSKASGNNRVFDYDNARELALSPTFPNRVYFENSISLSNNNAVRAERTDGTTARPIVPTTNADNIRIRIPETDKNVFIENSNGTRMLRIDDGDNTVKILDEDTQPGTNSNKAMTIGNGGAGFYIDSNGDVVAVDEGGNESTLT